MKQLRQMEDKQRRQREDEQLRQMEYHRKDEQLRQIKNMLTNIFIILIIFSILSVPIVLISMGGSAAYLGYLCALVLLYMVIRGLIVFRRWMVALAQGWVR